MLATASVFVPQWSKIWPLGRAGRGTVIGLFAGWLTVVVEMRVGPCMTRVVSEKLFGSILTVTLRSRLNGPVADVLL